MSYLGKAFFCGIVYLFGANLISAQVQESSDTIEIFNSSYSNDWTYMFEFELINSRNDRSILVLPPMSFVKLKIPDEGLSLFIEAKAVLYRNGARLEYPLFKPRTKTFEFQKNSNGKVFSIQKKDEKASFLLIESPSVERNDVKEVTLAGQRLDSQGLPDPLLEIPRLAKTDFSINQKEIFSLSENLTLQLRQSLYDELHLGHQYSLLNFFPGMGLGSDLQGDRLMGGILFVSELFADYAFLYWIGKNTILLASSNKTTDSAGAQIGFTVIFFSLKVFGVVAAESYTNSYNRSLEQALRLDTRN